MADDVLAIDCQLQRNEPLALEYVKLAVWPILVSGGPVCAGAA